MIHNLEEKLLELAKNIIFQRFFRYWPHSKDLDANHNETFDSTRLASESDVQFKTKQSKYTHMCAYIVHLRTNFAITHKILR